MRTVVAFLVAPLLPALWAALSTDDYPRLAVFGIICLALYGVQALIGVPAYLLLRRAGQHRVGIYMALGFGAIAVPFLIVGLLRGEPGFAFGEILYLTFRFGLLGIAAGLVFWLVARPDKVALKVDVPTP